MISFQKVLIVVLGIILSFLLFFEGERYLESSDYGQIIENCKETNFNCEYLSLEDKDKIQKKYGANYWELKSKLKGQRAYIIIPIILVIITAFVSFTLDKEEMLVSAIVLMPFLGSLMVKYFFDTECCLVPFYLLYIIVFSFAFSFIKRAFWKLDP